MYTKLLANCVAWFQWIKDIKQKKKEEKQKEMEKNIRRSPRQIDIKQFYKESSSSEEERKKTKKAIKKIASPPKVQVLCHLILAWLVVVSFWQRLLLVDSFSFWPGFRLSHLGTAAFEPSLKQATQK